MVSPLPSGPRPRHRPSLRVVATFACAGVAVAVLVACWTSRTAHPAHSAPAELTLGLADLISLEGRLRPVDATNELFNGWVVERYPDGSLRSRSRLVDGRLHGLSEGWHPSGQVQVREHYVDGEAHGLVTRWHANGTRLSEGMALNGRLLGPFRRWHDNGVLAEELTFQGGQPHGLAKSWFRDGQPKAEVVLEGGKVLRQQFNFNGVASK